MGKPKTAKEALDQLGAKWSPDFDAYASGEISNPPLRALPGDAVQVPGVRDA